MWITIYNPTQQQKIIHKKTETMVTFIKHTKWTGHQWTCAEDKQFLLFFSFFFKFLYWLGLFQHAITKSHTVKTPQKQSCFCCTRGGARKADMIRGSFGSACTVCDRASGARASARETDKILHCQTRNRGQNLIYLIAVRFGNRKTEFSTRQYRPGE